MITVLPPIPTIDVPVDDVSALAARVRDQMLTTLREISVTVPSKEIEKSPVTESPGDAVSAEQGTPTPTIPSESISSIESTPSQSEMASTTVSQVLSKDGSENGTETEEEEGMVMVGHPK
jgi:lysophosphatidate acyltransferase